MTVSGELCCVTLPFCCVAVVALPFPASLGVIVHTYIYAASSFTMSVLGYYCTCAKNACTCTCEYTHTSGTWSQNGYMYSLNYSLHQFTHINIQECSAFLVTRSDPTTVLSFNIVQGPLLIETRLASHSCTDIVWWANRSMHMHCRRPLQDCMNNMVNWQVDVSHSSCFEGWFFYLYATYHNISF